MLRHKVCTILTLVACGWARTAAPFDEGETKRPSEASPDYKTRRRQIVEDELQARGASLQSLTAAERRVDAYLNGFREHDAAAVRDLQTNRRLLAHDRRLVKGTLYGHLQQMPKGAVLHAHAAGIQDLHWLVETAVARNDCYLYHARPEEKSELHGCFQIAAQPPADPRWQSVARLRAQSDDPARFDRRLYESLTLGAEDRDVENIWDEFEACWRRICSLSDHPLIYRDFYRRELEAVAASNVQILELRTFLDFPYREGQPVEAAAALRDLAALNREVVQKYPDFKLRVIYSRDRSAPLAAIKNYLAEAVELRQAHPQLVCGFDLVGHEQTGRTLQELAPLFLEARGRAERAGTTLPLFLHAGETAQRGFGNIVDAVLLDAARIGHGLSLVDHPTLRARLKAQSIGLEICPFSSYVLRNIGDMAEHPARAWHRDGMRICINPDNPGLMGCDLALDWYLVFVTWQLSLAELKKLVLNGIEASSLDNEERQAVIQNWDERWKVWIEAVDREAQARP